MTHHKHGRDVCDCHGRVAVIAPQAPCLVRPQAPIHTPIFSPTVVPVCHEQRPMVSFSPLCQPKRSESSCACRPSSHEECRCREKHEFSCACKPASHEECKCEKRCDIDRCERRCEPPVSCQPCKQRCGKRCPSPIRCVPTRPCIPCKPRCEKPPECPAFRVGQFQAFGVTTSAIGVQTAMLTKINGTFDLAPDGGIKIPTPGSYEITYSATSETDPGRNALLGSYASVVSSSPSTGTMPRVLSSSQALSGTGTYVGAGPLAVMNGSTIIMERQASTIYLAFPNNSWLDPHFPAGTGAPITVTVKGDYDVLTRMTTGCPGPCDDKSTII